MPRKGVFVSQVEAQEQSKAQPKKATPKETMQVLIHQKYGSSDKVLQSYLDKCLRHVIDPMKLCHPKKIKDILRGTAQHHQQFKKAMERYSKDIDVRNFSNEIENWLQKRPSSLIKNERALGRLGLFYFHVCKVYLEENLPHHAFVIPVWSDISAVRLELSAAKEAPAQDVVIVLSGSEDDEAPLSLQAQAQVADSSPTTVMSDDSDSATLPDPITFGKKLFRKSKSGAPDLHHKGAKDGPADDPLAESISPHGEPIGARSGTRARRTAANVTPLRCESSKSKPQRSDHGIPKAKQPKLKSSARKDDDLGAMKWELDDSDY